MPRERLRRCLVTGIDGFAGSHLCDLLIRRRYSVHGTIRRPQADPRAELSAEVVTYRVDLLDQDAVEALVDEVRPHWVFHLAALSSPAASWDDPGGTIATNASLEANLLGALVRLDPMPRVLVVGSGDEYGRPSGRARRLDEDTPLRPLTPYGVSKVAQDLLALQYHLSHGLPAIRVRPFNHAGPRQAPQFAIASFAQQIARIELGKQPPVLKVAIFSLVATLRMSATSRAPISSRWRRGSRVRCTTSARDRRRGSATSSHAS